MPRLTWTFVHATNVSVHENVSITKCFVRARAISERNLFSIDFAIDCNFFHFSFKLQSFLPILLFTIVWSFDFALGLYGAIIEIISCKNISKSCLSSSRFVFFIFLQQLKCHVRTYVRLCSETKNVTTILSRYHRSKCTTKSILLVSYCIVSAYHAEWVKGGYSFTRMVTCFRRDQISQSFCIILYRMTYIPRRISYIHESTLQW